MPVFRSGRQSSTAFQGFSLPIVHQGQSKRIKAGDAHPIRRGTEGYKGDSLNDRGGMSGAWQ